MESLNIELLSLGDIGEEIASRYLKRKGFRILLRNYAKKFGEIDIVAVDQKGVLVCVEVKTLKILDGRGLSQISPEDNMTEAKKNKLRKVVSYFANKYARRIGRNGETRIDVIAIEIQDRDTHELTEVENHCIIKHYVNAV